jgi:hypothetical protein
MVEIHCHACGGFMSDLSLISYRLPTPAERGAAAPRSGLCACGASVVYGAPPSDVAAPGMPPLSAAPLATSPV